MIKQEAIKMISLNDIRKRPELIVYDDEDIVVTRTFKAENINVVRANCLIIVSCKVGYMDINVYGYHYHLHKGEHLLYLPGMLMSDVSYSSDFDAYSLCISVGFFRSLLPMAKTDWRMVAYFKNKLPVRRENDLKDYSIKYKCYMSLLNEQITQKGFLHKEIIKHLLSAMFLESSASIKEVQQKDKEELNYSFNYTAPEQLFRRFNDLVTADNGRHRSVTYFADRLCYTAKYVSNVSKRVCGMTATELIDTHVVQLIKYQLIHTDNSIKQIVGEFDFPNLSFFGRYVKKHLGMSPKAYREMRQKQFNDANV